MQIIPDANKIKRWREERCWSQEHMADISGLGLRTIQRIENGARASQDSVMALAAAFNVDAIALTIDPEEQAKQITAREDKKTRAALRLSFFIHFASYIFGLLVFTAISLSDAAPGYAMAAPAIWWTVGVAGHALTIIIVELSLRYKQ